MAREARLETIGEKVALGAFVVVETHAARGLGVGKVVELLGHHATVAYFDVPDDEPALQINVPVGAVRVVSLPEQARVFRRHEDTGRWQVGRIAEGDGPTCLVAFPNRVTANVPREELMVRWRKPISNPTEFLIRHVTETPLFAEARSRFVRVVTNQRTACRGIGALLSSSVELVAYQFNVVRKVLQDPVQRYLLADEVGLGKTIEAGLLMRQFALEVSDARILLIVPPSLVTQWRLELVQRFGLRDWLDDHIWIISSDDLSSAAAHMSTAGMVVIDEAHHLSRRSSEGVNPLYELLRKHAAAIPRLFLLSGTPVLADTEGFLRLLHLLEPVVFPLDDLAAFERRLQSRQLVAEIAASLQPENVLVMEDDLDRLCDAFGNDPALMKRVEALRPIVQSLPEEDDEEFLSALTDLRAHLSEAYKLHRRVVRNRRKSVPWATPKRKGLQIVPYASRWQSERRRVIDDLRVCLVNADQAAAVTQALFSSAVHAGSSESLEEVLRVLGVRDTRALELAKQTDDLRRHAEEAGDRDRATKGAIRDCLLTPGVQVVVFCDTPGTADRLHSYLGNELVGVAKVLRHALTSGGIDSDEDRAEEWRRFLSEPDLFRVLVCDFRAEEGLNLHGGQKVAFHYDFPPAPNRIEQRIGRLDRFGAGSSIRSLAPVCEDDATEAAWVGCLSEGLQVFDVSIASLQYLVEGTLKAAIQEWCDEGVVGLHRWKDHLSGPAGWAARERRRIDQQDALDAMVERHGEEFEFLEEVDDQWRDWKSAFDGFAFNALLFHSRPETWSGSLPDGEGVFRLNYARDQNRRTLLSLQDFVGQFLGTIDTEERNSTAKSPLSYPYAYSRRTVLSKQGKAKGLRSLRYGDSLVNSLASFCQSDDRGRVFAMWRHRPTFEAKDSSGCDLWFRFDFLFEANLGESEDDVTRALRRRAEQHFSPQFYTVWVNAVGGAALQPPDVLMEPYRKADGGNGRDFNLSPRRWNALQMQVESVPWLMRWRHHCESAAANAATYITAHELFQQQVTRGLASLRSQHSTRLAQIESRITRLTSAAQSAERRDLDEERVFFARLSEAIASPLVRTDVAGAVFLSGRKPGFE